MYARWVLSDLPPPEILWKGVGGVLTPAVTRRLTRLLLRSGVAVDGKYADSVTA